MTVAVVPMKRLSEAKRRLSTVLDDKSRRHLAETMLRDVLAGLSSAPSVQEVLVISPDDAVAAIASGSGVRFHREDNPRGLDAAVTLAAGLLAGEGVASMLYVPGDVPLATWQELETVTRAARNASFVIVPSHDRDGTNAMALSPPTLFSPAFGPGSFERHLRLAGHAGARAEVLDLPGLSVDIDTPDDLARLVRARHGDDRYAFLKTPEPAGSAA
ncbi:MAG: 2-phospho-L-lactate guanylyltransferase [Hyphomicrobiales bacterium]